MRRLALMAVAAGLTSLSAVSSRAADTPPTCRIVGQMYDSKDVLCTIAATEPPRPYEFIARFSGGHDDTQASITTALNDQALPCEAGSKKELMGEDGNVMLFCRFTATPGAGGEARFKATIRWSHAEYTDYQLTVR